MRPQPQPREGLSSLGDLLVPQRKSARPLERVTSLREVFLAVGKAPAEGRLGLCEVDTAGMHVPTHPAFTMPSTRAHTAEGSQEACAYFRHRREETAEVWVPWK